MKRKIVISQDGSSSVFDEQTKQHFHSQFGAIQESKHIFIEAGWRAANATNSSEITVLEIGMGTGLNILLTFLESIKDKKTVFYETVEKYPLTQKEVAQLNYLNFFNTQEASHFFSKLHSCDWSKVQKLTPSFTFIKHHCCALDFNYRQRFFNLVYFDPFSPEVQPELWTYDFFAKIALSMKPLGILVTYCIKGEVRRILKSLGFEIEKLPGPPGKREILRACLQH